MPTLHWLNREEALGGADAAPYRLLVEEAGLSAGLGDAGNMLVQGDNLEALKSLLPMFAGRVLVVEYKGAHLEAGEQEKRDVGRLWQDRSNGQAVFLWALKQDAAGRTLSQQVKAAVGYWWRMMI